MLEIGFGYVLLLIRVVLAGAVWSPLPSNPTRNDRFSRAGRVVILGLLLNLLPALALASLNVWSPLLDLLSWLTVVLVGVVIRGKSCVSLTGAIRDVAYSSLIIGVFGLVALLLPLRSEWLAGGWDPGIYQNNAVVIADKNGFAPRTDTIYADMTPEERALFVRSSGTYNEIFPAIPLDMETGETSLYFFHLTPLSGAWFFRMGGMGLLNRMPVVLAFWGLLTFFTLLTAIGLKGWRAWVGVVFVLLSPTWWYQQAIPTSELLYLIFAMGGLFLYGEAYQREQRYPLWLYLTLFAATINHFNFPVLAIMLLLVAAVAESLSKRNGRYHRLIGCFVAISLGMLWDLHFAAITILRLDEKDSVLNIMLPIVGGGSLACVVTAWLPWLHTYRRAATMALRMAGMAVALGLLVLAIMFSIDPVRTALFRVAGHIPFVESMLVRLLRPMQLNGLAWFGLAFAGMMGLSIHRENRHALSLMVLALTGAWLVLASNPGIAPIYPWALRRYVVVLVLLTAMSQTYAFLWMVESWSRWRSIARISMALLLLGAVGQGAIKSAEAFRVGDYKGMAAFLDELKLYLHPDDIVVADDPRWGTPLYLMMHHDVISGRRLWQSKDEVYRQQCMTTLDRLHRETGRRIVWLTSTRERLNLYPFDLGETDTIPVDLSLTYNTIMHSGRARVFATEQQAKVFGLYVWKGWTTRPDGEFTPQPAEPVISP